MYKTLFSLLLLLIVANASPLYAGQLGPGQNDSSFLSQKTPALKSKRQEMKILFNPQHSRSAKAGLAQQSRGMGLLSLGFGILAFVLFAFSNWVLLIAALASGVLALIFGFRSLKAGHKRGMAIAGIILGGLAVVLPLLTLLLLGLSFGA